MPITNDHIGRVYPPGEPYAVTRSKIAEFAAALGDDGPAYGGREPIAPPTFAIVVASDAWQQVFADAELGLALNRTIHVEQSFAHVRPLRAGDEVVATTRIANVRTRGQVDMITLDVDIDTTDGERVCTATTQVFHTREEDAS
ncbi:MaoC family dehydratase N-terminal domain-containing protein [Mariniluteicoccus endophyticus]